MQYSGEFPGDFCGLASVPGRGAEGTDILKAREHDQKEMFLSVCPLCFRDAPTKKATVVPQGESSEPSPKCCSTSCLSTYEDSQNLRKRVLNKSRCTICNKLTEVWTFI